MCISIDKKYRLRDGSRVEILRIDLDNQHYPIVAIINNKQVCQFTKDGKYVVNNSNTEPDLIEVSPWDDFEVNEPVMVRDVVTDGIGNWVREHFAGISDDGKPETWRHGTKWAGMGMRFTWDECRRPTPEELKD